MVTSNEIINVDFLVGKNELAGISKHIGAIRKDMTSLERFNPSKIVQTNKLLGDMENTISKARMQTTKFGQWWEKSQQGVYGFNGALLSTLFFGMEMNRIFGGALKSVFEGYKKLLPEQSAFNIMTTRLSANWEFFKFQLADALANSPLFQALIGYAIKLVQSFQQLSEGTKTFMIAAAGILAVTGMFLQFVGVVGLGIAGLADMGITMAAVKTTALGLGAALAFAVVIKGTQALMDFAQQTVTGKASADALSESYSGLAKNITESLSGAFTGLNVEFQTNAEMMAYWGQVAQNLLAYIGTAFSGFVLLWKTGWNMSQSLMAIAILSITSRLETLVNVIAKVATAMDAVFDTNISSGINDTLSDIESFNDALRETVNQTEDINTAWSDFQSQVDSFGSAIASPSQVATEYGQLNDIRSGEYQNITNINVMTASDALAQGLITNDQYNDFMQTLATVNSFQTGN